MTDRLRDQLDKVPQSNVESFEVGYNANGCEARGQQAACVCYNIIYSQDTSNTHRVKTEFNSTKEL